MSKEIKIGPRLSPPLPPRPAFGDNKEEKSLLYETLDKVESGRTDTFWYRMGWVVGLGLTLLTLLAVATMAGALWKAFCWVWGI